MAIGFASLANNFEDNYIEFTEWLIEYHTEMQNKNDISQHSKQEIQYEINALKDRLERMENQNNSK